MKDLLKRILPILDIGFFFFTFPSAMILKALRIAGVQRMPFSKWALLKIGVFPIRDHYYEPQFDYGHGAESLSKERRLPGIDWNLNEQLENLGRLSFADELSDIPMGKPADVRYYFDNPSFKSGDAEFWYQLIRLKKPRRIFEIGSGNSTLMAILAIRKNKEEDPAYQCKHVCIEPFEMPWLEGTGVTVIRKKVEEMDVAFFSELTENDVLFIDSSHIIRPHGDVLFEYLELMPTLNQGVIVHIHDIFSPRNYLKEFLADKVFFWNEQFLLEAFLTHNKNWKIIGALNQLHHNHYDALKRVCPRLDPGREPGSFYLQKVA